ncbi:TlpA family protein disulfide reductase [Evansella sp. LMS18]|uniref:TlpA family protein disulfide reductase n=1 Tax=Evansella sp. LMS18 TaxID=2924033 RepID=UPI0020D11CBD|nr:TlpA disulfide reductase family protein [Evansella sp. LMS18]UTR10766.1 TlpA family protein disulfide reductase [Evansella sp. LMS18]
MSLHKKILIVILVASAGAFLWMEQQQNNFTSGTDGQRASLPHPGHSAPDFILDQLSGEGPVHLREAARNHTGAVVYFWTSWCPFCSASMEAVEETHRVHGESIQLIGVNVTSQDSIQAAEDFLEEHSITFPNVMDQDGTVADMYYVPPVPAVFFVDSGGTIVYRKTGAVTTAELEQEISRLKEAD